nr:MAG TPA: hypothetical protein [Caudoviricetes sp.]
MPFLSRSIILSAAHFGNLLAILLSTLNILFTFLYGGYLLLLAPHYIYIISQMCYNIN